MPLDGTLIHQQLIDCVQQPIPAVEVLACIDSTNEYLKRALSADPDCLPRVCLAEQQTQAKASKAGRTWHSPAGQNLTFSCGISLDKPVAELSGLSLVVGLALIHGLVNDAASANDLKIKWPNDIYWRNKKLAGILTEISSVNSSLSQAIIGIGINVNMLDAPENGLNQPWTSLRLVYGQEQNRNQLAARLITQIFSDLALFQHYGLDYFLADWQTYDYLQGKPLQLHNAQGLQTGVASGINARGQLLLQDASGNLTAYATGDIVK